MRKWHSGGAARVEALNEVVDAQLDRCACAEALQQCRICQGVVELINDLKKYPGVKDLKAAPKTQSPVLPITFARDGERFSYFSLITTVGTPQCVSAQELRIECMTCFR